jgi:ABC-type multidrug transport system permease subunit
MSALVAAARIAWRTLPASLNRLTAVVRLVVAPAATAVFYLAVASRAGSREVDAGDAVAAALGSGAVLASVAVAELVASDRFNGTLPFLFVASEARVAAWVGRFGVVAGLGTGTSLIALVVPLGLTGGVAGADAWAALAIALACIAPASAGIGALLGAISMTFRDALAVANVAEYALPLLCGAVVSVTMMPGPVAWAARLFPLTHVLEAGRTGVTAGLSADFWHETGLGLGSGVVWAVAGWCVWRLVEERTRRTGTADGAWAPSRIRVRTSARAVRRGQTGT